ncbi:hypothetical protein CDAR_368411 [Caerostris darwini]|uniref:Uncharacterized protein n=1 Tax=Caerostris darwini TaxID=1538125 RepID=A0AAV4WEX1_9ARAC|nr:hypothetical protein CDAR_368411 [Caerostris darwini]
MQPFSDYLNMWRAIIIRRLVVLGCRSGRDCAPVEYWKTGFEFDWNLGGLTFPELHNSLSLGLYGTVLNNGDDLLVIFWITKAMRNWAVI